MNQEMKSAKTLQNWLGYSSLSLEKLIETPP